MGGVIVGHLDSCKTATGSRVNCEDLTDTLGKIDIQGVESARIVATILDNPEEVFTAMPYFSFKGWFRDGEEGVVPVRLEDGTPVLLSRTGYTGEFGFEIFVAGEKSGEVWNRLLAAGAEKGLIACGLAARDSLRAGAMLPLSHQDIGEWPFAGNPWLFALAGRDRAGKFTAPFVGSSALEELKPTEFTLAYAGYDLRKVVSADAVVTDIDGNRIGRVLTCVTDMALGRLKDGTIISVATPQEKGRPAGFRAKGLCCGFVKVTRKMAPGEQILLVDGRRTLKAEVRADIRPDRTARRALADMV